MWELRELTGAGSGTAARPFRLFRLGEREIGRGAGPGGGNGESETEDAGDATAEAADSL